MCQKVATFDLTTTLITYSIKNFTCKMELNKKAQSVEQIILFYLENIIHTDFF